MRRGRLAITSNRRACSDRALEIDPGLPPAWARIGANHLGMATSRSARKPSTAPRLGRPVVPAHQDFQHEALACATADRRRGGGRGVARVCRSSIPDDAAGGATPGCTASSLLNDCKKWVFTWCSASADFRTLARVLDLDGSAHCGPAGTTRLLWSGSVAQASLRGGHGALPWMVDFYLASDRPDAERLDARRRGRPQSAHGRRPFASRRRPMDTGRLTRRRPCCGRASRKPQRRDQRTQWCCAAAAALAAHQPTGGVGEIRNRLRVVARGRDAAERAPVA